MSLEYNKIKSLMRNKGFDNEDEFLESVIFDSTVPGICMFPECDYTTDVEPDQSKGYCEVCQCRSVKSILVLKGY